MEHLLTTLSRLKSDHELPGLLIGGHAVTALGHARATYDVDLLIPKNSSDQWLEILLPLGYQVFASNNNFVQLEAKPDWPLPAIDLMLVERSVFEALQEDQYEGAILPTPSATSMIALKLHAISHPSRRNQEQDWADILALIDIENLQLDDPVFSAIVQKHGGQQAVERIQAHLAGRDRL